MRESKHSHLRPYFFFVTEERELFHFLLQLPLKKAATYKQQPCRLALSHGRNNPPELITTLSPPGSHARSQGLVHKTFGNTTRGKGFLSLGIRDLILLLEETWGKKGLFIRGWTVQRLHILIHQTSSRARGGGHGAKLALPRALPSLLQPVLRAALRALSQNKAPLCLSLCQQK